MPQIEFGVKGKEGVIAACNEIQFNLKKLENNTSSLSNSNNNLDGSIGKVTGGLGGMALKASVVTAAVSLLAVGISKCTEAAREDALSQNRLTASLGFTSTALLKQSQALAEQHRITEGEIVNVQRLTSNYFNNSKSIEMLTPAIMNMSIATGKSTEAIAEQLSGAVKSGRGLKQYGLELQDCNTEEEKLEKITKWANERFGDQAKAVTDLRSPMSILGSDLQELSGTIGKVFLAFEKSPIVDKWLSDLSNGLKGIRDLIDMALPSTETDKLYKKQLELMALNNKIYDAEKTNTNRNNVLLNRDKKKAEELQKEVDVLKASVNKEKGNEAAKLAEEKALAEKAASEVLLEERQKELLKNRELSKKLADEEIELTKKLTYEKIKSEIEARGEGIDKALELLSLEKESELNNKKLTGEQKLLIIDKYRALEEKANKDWDEKIQEETQKNEIEKNKLIIEAAKERQETINNMYKIAGIEKDDENLPEDDPRKSKKEDSKAQKELKKKQRDELKQLKEQYKDKLDLAKEYGEAITALEKKQAKERKEAAFDENISKANFALNYTSNVISSIDAIMEATGASAKERKRLAQAGALISGAEGALGVVSNTDKYLETFGPIAGPIAMGIQIALMAGLAMSQVAQIEKAQFAYAGVASSRIVTGGTEGQDSVNATLMPGEIVYNPQHPNPYLAQLIASTVPGGIENNSENKAISIHNVVTINGSASKQEQKDLEKAIEQGTLKALKKAQQNGKFSISNSGKNIIIRK